MTLQRNLMPDGTGYSATVDVDGRYLPATRGPRGRGLVRHRRPPGRHRRLRRRRYRGPRAPGRRGDGAGPQRLARARAVDDGTERDPGFARSVRRWRGRRLLLDHPHAAARPVAQRAALRLRRPPARPRDRARRFDEVPRRRQIGAARSAVRPPQTPGARAARPRLDPGRVHGRPGRTPGGVTGQGSRTPRPGGLARARRLADRDRRRPARARRRRSSRRRRAPHDRTSAPGRGVPPHLPRGSPPARHDACRAPHVARALGSAFGDPGGHRARVHRGGDQRHRARVHRPARRRADRGRVRGWCAPGLGDRSRPVASPAPGRFARSGPRARSSGDRRHRRGAGRGGTTVRMRVGIP